jgi:DNA polymerase IV
VRKIIHIDMDAFYASVEQREKPSTIGKPLVVAHEGLRSVVCAASYEARAYGVRSAMPAVKARELCPGLIFIPPRISFYKQVSEQVFSIFARHTNIIEPLSLDEAFLDVTENKQNILSARQIAQSIRHDIRTELCLAASAGVSYNKFLAKLASDQAKPDGIFVIPPDKGMAYIMDLPVGKFFGIGPVSEAKLLQAGIKTGADLYKCDKVWLAKNFGKMGVRLYSIARGWDDRPVEPGKKRQSVGAELTFKQDISGLHLIFNSLEEVFLEAHSRMGASLEIPRTISLKIKYEDFEQLTRSKSLTGYTADLQEWKSALLSLCDTSILFAKKIRLIGVSFSNFEAHNRLGSQKTISFQK